MKNIFLFLLLTAVSISLVMAQIGGGGPPLSNPVPVDGGALALLGAGAAYGYKKIRDKRKSKEE
jgi:hypothetical protein